MSSPIYQMLSKHTDIIAVDDYMHARQMKDEDSEALFLHRLRMRNRLFKATHPNRLDDTIDLLLPYARQITSRPLRVLDAGCSSGISTLELHNALRGNGINCQTVGIDLALSAIQVKRDDGASILFDQDGNILQLDRWGVSMSWTIPPSKKTLIQHPVFALWGMAMLCFSADKFRAALNRNVPKMHKREVPLISSKFSNVEGLEIRQENILSPKDEPSYDIVRVANVLNPKTLDKDVIMTMLNALKKRVMDGGYLMILRSDVIVNNGTLFRCENNILVPVAQLNGGWEGTQNL